MHTGHGCTTSVPNRCQGTNLKAFVIKRYGWVWQRWVTIKKQKFPCWSRPLQWLCGQVVFLEVKNYILRSRIECSNVFLLLRSVEVASSIKFSNTVLPTQPHITTMFILQLDLLLGQTSDVAWAVGTRRFGRWKRGLLGLDVGTRWWLNLENLEAPYVNPYALSILPWRY